MGEAEWRRLSADARVRQGAKRKGGVQWNLSTQTAFNNNRMGISCSSAEEEKRIEGEVGWMQKLFFLNKEMV